VVAEEERGAAQITEATLGQKVHPYGFRLGFNKTWHSRWFAGKTYADMLHRDLKLREDLKKRLSHAGVSEIDIERTANKMRINIYTSRPGIIIGRKGAEVDKLRDELQKMVGWRGLHQHPGDPASGARRAAGRREHRLSARAPCGVPPRDEEGDGEHVPVRRQGHQGPRRRTAQRIGDRALGVVPGWAAAAAHAEGGHRLRRGRARTTYGVIGVKVWLYKGEMAKARSRRREAI
jgi:small subunit ribosomal protein S3